MKHKFHLAAVLQVREMALEREEQMLARLNNELERLRVALAGAERDLKQFTRAREQAFQKHAIQAMHLHALAASATDMRNRVEALREQVVKFEKLRDDQQLRYQHAYKERELMLVLRDEDRAKWDAKQAKREADEAEQAFLARRFFEKKQAGG